MLQVSTLHCSIATYWLGHNAKLWRIGMVGAIATPLTGMLIACVFCLAFGLSSLETEVLLVFGALPPAVLNVMFAERYSQEPAKFASTVIVVNLMALFSISAALAFRLAA